MKDIELKKIIRINVSAILIFCFGLSQMLGFLFNISILRGIGAASTVAPLPKVFSDVDGVETFASTFILQFTDQDGLLQHVSITPEVYARLAGPYNRRNVYGAAFSYGPTPRFPKPLFDRVFEYGLIDPGTLRNEFGLPDGIRNIQFPAIGLLLQ